MIREKRSFNNEFKQEAVRQALDSGRPKSHVIRKMIIDIREDRIVRLTDVQVTLILMN